MLLNLNLVWAVVVRHLYHFRHSLDRLSDSFYWPAVNIILWGFTFQYVTQIGGNNLPDLLTVILAAEILFMTVWRGQYEITANLLEEMWNQNIVNFFSSPLRIREWMMAVFILGFIKLVISMSFAIILAYLLYNLNLYKLGYYFIPFMVSLLVAGWGFGLIIAALIVYYGMRIQAIAWMGVFVVVPFSGVYYSISTLPEWAQKVAAITPMSYVFEGMRDVILNGTFDWINFTKSLILDAVLLVIGVAFFLFMFKKSKEKGLQRLE